MGIVTDELKKTTKKERAAEARGASSTTKSGDPFAEGRAYWERKAQRAQRMNEAHAKNPGAARAAEARGATRAREDHTAGVFEGRVHRVYANPRSPDGSILIDYDDGHSAAFWRGYVRELVSRDVLPASMLSCRLVFGDAAAPEPVDPLVALRRKVTEQAAEIAALRAELNSLRAAMPFDAEAAE